MDDGVDFKVDSWNARMIENDTSKNDKRPFGPFVTPCCDDLGYR